MQTYSITTLDDYNDFQDFVRTSNVKCTNVTEDTLTFNNNEQFFFSLEYREKIKEQFKKDSAYTNHLIYGKNQIERIVSVEPKDGWLWLFKQTDDGIKIDKIPNKFWVVAAQKYAKDFERLKGNQPFTWIKEYDTIEAFDQARMYWRKYDTFTIHDLKENSLVRTGITYFKGLTPKEVSILSFDIETTGIKHNASSKVLLISNTYRCKDKVIKRLFAYDDYATPKEMFEDWSQWVCEMDPSIMCGHNIFMFDLPYIRYCADKAGAFLRLGRDLSTLNFNTWESKFRKDGSQFYKYKKAHIFGREIIDTMFLSIKYDVAERKYESYGLKQIIKHEGLEKQGRTFYDASKIKDNYKKSDEWAIIKQYCNEDSDDALKLYDLMCPAYFYMANSVPKSFQELLCTASGSQLNSMLIRAYLSDGYGIPKATDTKEYEGAISFGEPGIYKNLVKADAISLYPSIIRQYKLYNKEKDPNAYFLAMAEYFTEERIKNKKIAKEQKSKYHKDLQEAQKVLINSLFGFTSTTGLNFNDPTISAFITKTGRWVLGCGIKWLKENNYIIANGDTDGLLFCKADQSPFDSKEKQFTFSSLNSLMPEKIRFGDDGSFESCVVVAAKNYAFLDETEQIKIKGSGLRPAQKEKALKEFMIRLIEFLLTNKQDQILNVYQEYAKEIMSLKDITRWASKHTITDAILKPSRTNEQKVLDACKNIDIQMGDKIWLYFREDGSLRLQEEFDGNYCKDRLLDKLFKTLKIFSTVLDIKQYPNYSLKKNKKLLEVL